jgi:hypothetical protein
MKNYLRRISQKSMSKIKKNKQKPQSNFIIHKKKKKENDKEIVLEGINLKKIKTVKELIFSEEVLNRQEMTFQQESNFEMIDLLESEGLVNIPKRDREIAAKVLSESERTKSIPQIEEPVKSKKLPKERIVETEEDFFRELNRLNKAFEKSEISYGESDIRASIEDYKKRQIETAKSKLTFDDMLKIYIKFLRNPKVQKEKYIEAFEKVKEQPDEGLNQIKNICLNLTHQNEIIFFLKAFAQKAEHLDSWEIWRIWDALENQVVSCAKFCSLEEMELISEMMTKIGVVSNPFVHEYEALLLDSKSELFSIERAQIFNKFYNIIKFFISQKEVRSEFLFEISRWSILMHM